MSAIALLLAGAEASASDPAQDGGSGTPKDAGEHCIAHLEEADALSAERPTSLTCFDSFTDVASALGYAGTEVEGLTPAQFASDSRFEAAQANTLAIHFDYFENPDSLTITGGQCDGGGLTLATNWRNRIDATIHMGCGTIKHYDGNSYAGTMEQTQGSYQQTKWLQNLGNQVNSVRCYA